MADIDKQTRVELIRKANELMNAGDVDKARDIFIMCDYSGGILRVADYYMWRLKQPLRALPLYKRINATKQVDDIIGRLRGAFLQWWYEDEINAQKAADEKKQKAVAAAATPEEIPLDPESIKKLIERKQEELTGKPASPPRPAAKKAQPPAEKKEPKEEQQRYDATAPGWSTNPTPIRKKKK